MISYSPFPSLNVSGPLIRARKLLPANTRNSQGSCNQIINNTSGFTQLVKLVADYSIHSQRPANPGPDAKIGPRTVSSRPARFVLIVRYCPKEYKIFILFNNGL